MGDSISRQALLDDLQKNLREYVSVGIPRQAEPIIRMFLETIKSSPSAQPERKKGEWVRNFDGNEWYWFCSNCKEEWYEEDLWMGGNDFPNFCPNCGADMKEKEE